LGSILLAVALAAPIDKESETTPPPVATVSAGLEKLETTDLPVAFKRIEVTAVTDPTHPTEPNAANAEQVAQMMEEYEQQIREKLASIGLPEEAIEEFFAEGFARPPYDEEKRDRFMVWSEKWQSVFVKFAATNERVKKVQEKSKEATRRLNQFFENILEVTRMMEALSEEVIPVDGDVVRYREIYQALKDKMYKLSKYEQEIISKVYSHIFEQIEEAEDNDTY
ncbi:hypothetical protein PENTCL1PPCAC_8739, partial [Pristionchus entomophagus]